MTNREKINAMSNRDLAIFLNENDCNCSLCAYCKLEDCGGESCVSGYQKWLENEAEP